MGTGDGFGKTILFGEHFVVHGLPAIVAALAHQMKVVVTQKKHLPHTLIDKTKKFPGVPLLTWKLCHASLERMLNQLTITAPLQITLQGDLPIPHGGIGSSAALCVAFARALSNEFGLRLTNEQINALAFIGESEIHGTPSGIDNTAATYGGMFRFERGDRTPIEIGPIEIEPIEIVLIESGKSTNTKTVIDAVKAFQEDNRELVASIFNDYQKLVDHAFQALQDYDLSRVGTLMNENHRLLQKLTVSCDELDTIVQMARDAGALGAKLTGTGRGGLVVALTPGAQRQAAVAQALDNAGYAVLPTTIG